jgi:hypothetical protein
MPQNILKVFEDKIVGYRRIVFVFFVVVFDFVFDEGDFFGLGNSTGYKGAKQFGGFEKIAEGFKDFLRIVSIYFSPSSVPSGMSV